VQEYLTYSGGNHFQYPSPPFEVRSEPNPKIISVPGTTPSMNDDHSTGFTTPYQAASFTVTQYYQYICPCANGGQALNVMGPNTINRSVYFDNSSNKWKFTITKAGVTATIDLP
jgi:hypothetical protein